MNRLSPFNAEQVYSIIEIAKRFFFSLFTILLFPLFLSTALGQGKFPLEHVYLDDLNHPFLDIQYTQVDWYRNKPVQVKSIPKKLSKEAIWFGWTFPTLNLTMVLDIEGDNLVLYPDRDYDGDIAEEAPIKRSIPKRGTDAKPSDFNFGFIEFRKGTGEESRCLKYKVSIDPSTSKYGVVLRVGNAEIHKGKIKAGNKSYDFAVLDYQLDGRYNRTKKNAGIWQYDIIWIDRDGNGDYDVGIGKWELQPLPTKLYLDGVCYSLKVSPWGSYVTLDKIEPECGYIKAKDPDLGFIAEHDDEIVSLANPGGEWRLEKGEYSLFYGTLGKKDNKGNEWRIFSLKTPIIRIEPGKTYDMDFGSPLSVVTKVESDKGRIFVDIVLKGNGGEEYTPVFFKNGKAQEPLEFTVISHSGKKLDEGTLTQNEYGRYLSLLNLPEDLKEPYKIDIKIKTGPFEVKQDETWHDL